MDKRRLEICKAIQSIWTSLDSHLEYCHTPLTKKNIPKHLYVIHGDQKFHIKTVKEYASVIKTLAEQL